MLLLHIKWTPVEGVPGKRDTPVFVVWDGGALGGELSMGGASRMLVQDHGSSTARGGG